VADELPAGQVGVDFVKRQRRLYQILAVGKLSTACLADERDSSKSVAIGPLVPCILAVDRNRALATYPPRFRLPFQPSS
jgi:hypothetical protein